MSYRDLVRQTASEVGLDPNLAEAIMAQESGGNPTAVSKAGARGLMQLMPGTAKELGVDPSDPVQNIQGGVRYLKQQIDKYGIEGGIAAYNAGPGRVQKANGDFNALPEETRAYVPAVMNRAAQLAAAGSGEPGVASDTPKFGMADFMSAFDKAQAAGDTAAVNEIGSQLQKQFSDALAKAQAAGDTAAVQEISQAASKYGVKAPEIQAPAAPQKSQQQLDAIYKQQQAAGNTAVQPAATVAPSSGITKKDVGHFLHGVGDTLTFGFMDELAGKGAELFGKDGKAVTDFLRKDAKEGGNAMLAGQVAGAFVPGMGTLGAVRAVPTAGRLARAAAGAATGAIQGGLYGAGSAEGDLNSRIEGAKEGAAWGAAGGGLISGVMPATVGQKVNDYVKKAGSEDAAALQAEIAQRVKKEFDNPARMVNGKLPEMTPKEINGKVVDSFLREGKVVVDQLPKDSPGKKQLTAALTRGLKNTTDELEALKTVPGGSEVADIINKATKADKMTSQVLQSPTMLAYGIRGLANAVPPVVGGALGGPLGFATGAILDRYAVAPLARHLTGKMTRTEVGQNIVDKVSKLADPVLEKTGPSQATQSLETLQQLAQRAKAGRQAQVAQQQAQQAAALAQQAANKNQILQQTRMPSGGGFQELLNGGASGLNMTSREAIDALRTVSKAAKGTPVGDAAATMLKSQPVKDEQAFYGVQNMIRRLSEEGKIPGVGQPGALSELSSGVRNPISYAANVKNATEALKVARDAAPTKELAQFASSVGGIKGKADKLKAVEERLSKATDPAEVEYLTKLVKPLANFGKK